MKKWGIWVLSLVFVFTLQAQHAFYSSLNQNLLSMNPAFAGTNEKLRAQVASGRTGWPKYGQDQQAYYCGVDVAGRKYSGFGLSFSSQNYRSVYRVTQIDFSYALHFTIKNKIKIIHAYQLSFFQNKIDRKNLPLDDYSSGGPFVPEFDSYSGISYKYNADFSSGLLVYGKRFYASLSILSITQPDEGVMGVSKRPLTQIYQGKYKFLDPDNFNFDVYGFVKYQHFGKYSTDVTANFLQYGTYLNWKVISLHLAHRLNDISGYDAIILGIAINSKKGLKVGYNNRCNYGSHLSNVYFNEFYIQLSLGKIKKDPEEKDTSIRLID